jgi:hypothetical protein
VSVINDEIIAALLSICLFTLNLNNAKNIIQEKIYESNSFNRVLSYKEINILEITKIIGSVAINIE